jgi:hypothetical protein
MKLRCLLAVVAVIATLAFAGVQTPAQAGSISYLVTVNTTGLSGSGFLEAAVSAASPVSPASVTATITGATGSFGASSIISGTGSTPTGNFSTTLTMTNDNATATISGLTDLQQVYNFPASGISTFELTLSGPEIGVSKNVSGTVFSLFIEDSAGNPLNGPPGAAASNGGPSPNLAGEALDIYVASPTPFGIGAPLFLEEDTFPANTDSGFPFVTLSPFTTIPEPGTAVLLGIGFAGIFVANRFRKRRAA